MNKAHITQVAYEADRALMRVLNRHREAITPWLSLRPEAKAMWIERGPPDEPIRKRLWDSVFSSFLGDP